MKKVKLTFTIVLSLGIFSSLSAQTNDSAQPKKVSYSAGLTAGFLPQYQGSSDFAVIPFVLFTADWTNGRYVRLGQGIEANILASRKWSFGPKLGFTVARNNDFVDNDAVGSMEEIDLSISAGLFAQYKFDNGFDAKAEYTHDISGVSEGGLAIVELGYSIKSQRLITRLFTNASFATGNYMETYFGVNSENVGSSQLPFYDLSAGVRDIGFGINPTYIVNSKWILSGRVKFGVLVGDVADSPIVETGSTNQFNGGIAIIRRF